jgi:vacuolar-type H+-ATPase subunit H
MTEELITAGGAHASPQPPDARPPLVPRRTASEAASAPPAVPEALAPVAREPRGAGVAIADRRPGRAPVAAGMDPHVVAGVPRPAPHGTSLTGMDRGTEQAAELVIDLLDAVESLVVNGRRVPFSAAVMVNEDEALDYVDRARAALPDDVKQARVLVERQREVIAEAEDHSGRMVTAARAEGDRIVAAAREEAERIIAAAHTEAQRVTQTARDHAAALVSTHAITVAAEQGAEEIASRAAADADAERAQADAYAREVLGGLAAQVEKALGQLHRGMEMLPGVQEPAMASTGSRRRR